MFPRFRSLLFVPGNKGDMLGKTVARCTGASQPDVLMPDLEDSVPLSEKATARSVVASKLHLLCQQPWHVIPRINAVSTSAWRSDLLAMSSCFKIAGVSVGKVQSADDVRSIDSELCCIEASLNLSHRLCMIPWIETARGVMNAASICSASPRVAAVAFGAEDFARDMQLPHEASTNHDALRTARSIVAMAAHSCGVQPLDGPFVKFKDSLALEKEIAHVRMLGYTGKFAIHPDQVQTLRHGFKPSDADVAWAFRVVQAMEAAEREGRASTSLDGIMIDTPVYTRCKQLLLSEQLLKSTHE